MTEDSTPLRAIEWTLPAAVALLGSLVLFDAYPGINRPLWAAAAVVAAILCRRSGPRRTPRAALLLGGGAILAAGAALRTTDTEVHAGIGWLTAFLLGAFICAIHADDGDAITLFSLITSPFVAAIRVATSAARELGIAGRRAISAPANPILRRTVLVAPVVVLLLVLLGGADPIIHSAIQAVQSWLPGIVVSDRTVFFTVLFLLALGACSRLPNLQFGIPKPEFPMRNGPTATDGIILVGSTVATLGAFLVLQVIYLFVGLPGQVGNGVTYAEYARRGFGQLCVVVTIVAGVILFAEKFRHGGDPSRSRTLRKMEFAAVAAAGLILLSAARRVVLYEHAFGYTTARVHATAYMVFMAGFLALLAHQLVRGAITPALGRRSAALALTVLLVVLYWNDQAWIMDRNIDRVRATGKFDVSYASGLSADAFPTLANRRNELPAGAWEYLSARASCHPIRGPFAWYEWNWVRSAAQTARDAVQLPETSKCPPRIPAPPTEG